MGETSEAFMTDRRDFVKFLAAAPLAHFAVSALDLEEAAIQTRETLEKLAERGQQYQPKVFTPAEDMASAIIKFKNGAVAHLTANRVALKPMRKMRVFSKQGYASLDFQASTGMLVKKAPGWDFEKLDLERLDRAQMGDLWKFVFDGLLQVENLTLDSGNPLQEELVDFLRCVRERGRPIVSGEDDEAAVQAAERVLAAIAQNRWQ